MQRTWLFLALLVCSISIVNCIPKFHTVNHSFYNGTLCPAVTKYNVKCPILCVPDLSACPSSIGPQTCASGTTLCEDGTCRAQCSGAVNVCQCPSQPGIKLRACASSLTVNIDHYDPSNDQIQTLSTCSATLGKPSGYNTWETISLGAQDSAWNVCEAPPGIDFPIQSPFVLSYLGIYFAFYVLLFPWILYKKIREKHTMKQEKIPLNEKYDDIKTLDSIETPKVVLRGFSNDWFGNFIVLYMVIVSIAFTIFLLVLSLDYYGYIDGIPYTLTYASYALNSKAFCLLWFLATSWYLVINITRTKLRNYFRIRQPLEKAKYVQIDLPRQVVQMHTKNVKTSESLTVIERVQIADTWIRKVLGFDYISVTSNVLHTSLETRYFEFQSTRYLWTDEKANFEPSSIMLGSNPDTLLKMKSGLTSNEAAKRLELIGQNFIAVHVPSFAVAIWEELTGFFYLYQIMILWCYFYLAYWQIGISDTLIILLAGIIKVIVRLRSEYRVKSMAEHVTTCKVLRDQIWKEESTANLIPGDVIEINAPDVVPVDAVIIQGDIVVDESSLTGEPLPIRKFPLRNDGQLYDRSMGGKIHTLFAGTTVRQSSPQSWALVLETRTNTDKGKLVQKILYPQEVSFVFTEQLKLVFVILICYALFLLAIGSWWLGGKGMTAWFYGTICAAQVMNPLLPAMLVVGQSVAAGRLKAKGVYCVDLPRILVAGKTQVFCFDKTGTLTKEGLEYYGAYPSMALHEGSVNITSFGELKHEYSQLNGSDSERLIQMGMASCHSVTTLGSEYIGNPVDSVMFQITGAKLSVDGTTDTILPQAETPNHVPSRLEVVQRFEFQHSRASMSVAVRDTNTNHIHIFCKGSFEHIHDISTSASVPSDFDIVTAKMAREGCYVLGLAHRDLGPDIDSNTVRSWTRDTLESNLDFLGLILFKNLLKEDTADAIAQLKEGDTRVVMITGDNALTGISVGQACGLVPASVEIILGDVEGSESKEKANVVWRDLEGKGPIDIVSALADPSRSIELAVTGKAFHALVLDDSMRDYLFDTRIFARMTPVDKMTCVELFMERAITAMCGDGGNDCGALRAAHVGIAMSEAEASVVSPFSTPKRSVQSCVDLLIEGRAALATSFASYKYLIMYGETMATVKFFTFYYTMSFSEWNFILVDAFITVFCSIAVTQAGPAKRLAPSRPTARILGPQVLFSVIGQLVINALFLVCSFIWLYQQDGFFRCFEWDSRAIDPSMWWLMGDSFEASVVTFVTLFQFVNAAIIFNYGGIFRRAWYRNYFLAFVCAVFIIIVSYWELADPNSFGCLVRLNCGDPDVLVSLGYPRPDYYIQPYINPLRHNVLPKDFRYKLWAYSIGNMLLTNAWEFFVVMGPVRNWLRRKTPLQRLKVKV